MLSHAIHYNRRRSDGPFLQVNRAAIPSTLLESELLGYEKGVFPIQIPPLREHRDDIPLLSVLPDQRARLG